MYKTGISPKLNGKPIAHIILASSSRSFSLLYEGSKLEPETLDGLNCVCTILEPPTPIYSGRGVPFF